MRLIVRRLNSPLIASKASAIATSGMRKPKSAINDGRGSCEKVKRRRKRNGLSPIVARIERIAAYVAAIAVRNTSASRMRIRALDRWSAVSLATTAPSPVQGDPIRRPGRGLLRSITRLLEIAGVHLVEARRGKVEADQLDLGGEVARDPGAQIARAIDPVALGVRPVAERLNPHDPRNCREALGDAGAAGLDIDDIAAAEHPPGQLGDRAGEDDTAAIEQRDPGA